MAEEQVTIAEEEEEEIAEKEKFSFLHIANYSLTEDFLLKMEKVQKELDENALKVSTRYLAAYYGMMQSYTTYLSNQPKVMAILKNNNITPKDFVAGCKVLEHLLMMLFQVTEGSEEDKLSPSERDIVLKNVEFGKKHMYRITSISRKVCE
ncbi:hypothetical protein [Bartonella jaculi]|uniref:Uncharacterized protein n=1 Tax=Bartonella jaculi TaxID=686226 RepID=A0ABP9MYS1_9HYPH